ncbi:hypothetical protein [Planctomycetes bacterium TBK1r]|uniref:Uncharacterized protein n=1 Tax=Stieleria magnilauensis TaxID=2527963 RepID=A0ABX5Y8E9_9BACT|nr:hypothetical protein TBK1r_75730 [Planctomycetes bacterium TBK1r]
MNKENLLFGVLMLFIGLSIGATSTPNEYDRACQNFMAETRAAQVVMKDDKRWEAARKRGEHWLSIMEQFRPTAAAPQQQPLQRGGEVTDPTLDKIRQEFPNFGR